MIWKILGFLMLVGGALLGLYVGVWVCFIGGIVDVITEVRAVTMVPMNIAIGIAKVMFSGFFGWLVAILICVPGFGLMFGGTTRKRIF